MDCKKGDRLKPVLLKQPLSPSGVPKIVELCAGRGVIYFGDVRTFPAHSVLHIFYGVGGLGEFHAQGNGIMNRTKPSGAAILPAILALGLSLAILPARAQDAPRTNTSGTTLGPPTMPIEEIISRFAAQEEEFKIERDNFTYTQTFIFQTVDDTNHVDGEFKQVSDILFDDRGRRVEKVTFAPVSTLERLTMTQEDFNDLEQVYPFVLTSEEVSKYDIKYVDHVPLDELNTYVFDVTPKTMEKKQRYFQGRIWVDDKDFQIVKTFGQPVGNVKNSKNGENLFPHYETFRENIEGKYWFPTYTRANDVLPFKSGDVHIRMTVRYENYKRFGVTVKIGKPAEQKQGK